MSVDPVIQIIGQLGVPGVLVWFLYYETTVANPKIIERIDRMQSKHDQTITAICADFTQTIRDERLARHEELQMLREEIRDSRIGR